MRAMLATLLAPLLLLAGCGYMGTGPMAERTTAATPPGRAFPAPGQPVRAIGPATDCLLLSRIRETRVQDDRTIDFRLTGGDIYRNTLPYGCPTLGAERRFSYQTSLSQLCRVDIIHVLIRNGPGVTEGAACGLGQFQPVVPVTPAG